MIKRFQRLVFHPFLFAIYPPLFLLVYNLGQMKFLSGLRATLICLVLAVILFFLFSLITRNPQRAGLLTSFLFILFFTYGPVRSVIPSWPLFGVPLSSHRYMFILWGIISGLVIWWLGWKIREPQNLNAFINITGIFLFVVLTIQGIVVARQETFQKLAALDVHPVTEQLNPPPANQQPDIYYIILDAYSSQTQLKDEFGIDNQDFIDGLKQRGFYVAQCSHSNYAYTSYSLASTLNMDYIPPVGAPIVDHLQSRNDFGPYLRFNSVRYTLQDLGYTTVAFYSDHPWSDISDADVYISLRGKSTISFQQVVGFLFGGTNEFEKVILDMTPLAVRAKILSFLHISSPTKTIIGDGPGGSTAGINDNAGEQKTLYDFDKYALNQLASVPSIPGKKFVYAHFYSTHVPYLFSADGAFAPDQSDTGYSNVIKYTSKVILDAIDQILEQTNPKPIIIVQGDHSPGRSQDRYAILNAYYLPGIKQDVLYPTISPVNTFRIVFNKYFGANLPLLADKSFWVHEYQGRFISELQAEDRDCK